MPELIAPTARLHTAWIEAHEEWGPGLHEDGFGVGPLDDVDSPIGFAAWVTRLAKAPDPSKPVEGGQVGCMYRWKWLLRLCEEYESSEVNSVPRPPCCRSTTPSSASIRITGAGEPRRRRLAYRVGRPRRVQG
jgi:hypothetical protein